MMKKSILLCLITIVFCGCTPNVEAQNKEEATIDNLLSSWHKAAAEAKYDLYFSIMTDDAIFIGTDATENWSKTAFKAFAKPYFDKGKAWNFNCLQRNIYISKDNKTAWFDELLDTKMKICRGSGVLVKKGKEWKITHYVLSMTIPNDNTDDVIKIKAPIEDALISKLKLKP